MNAPADPRASFSSVGRGGILAIALACIGLAVACPVPRATAQPAPAPRKQAPTDEQIADWIDELGHDVYAVRQLAADQLLGAGAAARDQLLIVAEGPDPEVRAAAKRLVTLIEETEFQRRLSAFAADTDGRLGLTLPGWEAFRTLVGNDAAARGLFVEMQQQEAELLSQVFGDKPPSDSSLWEQRLLRLLHRRAIPGRGVVTPSMGSCATMLFLGSLEKHGVSNQAGQQLVQLIQRSPVREAVGAGPEDAGRRLVVAWIVGCPNENQNILRQRLDIALKHELTEALPLALAVSHGDPEYLTVAPTVRVKAILAVGKLGGQAHTAELEPLLEDATVCVTSTRSSDISDKTRAEVQIRDVALAVILQLNNLDLKEYGFEEARRHNEELFNMNTLGMASDAERTRAIAKWRKWKAEHAAER